MTNRGFLSGSKGGDEGGSCGERSAMVETAASEDSDGESSAIVERATSDGDSDGESTAAARAAKAAEMAVSNH